MATIVKVDQDTTVTIFRVPFHGIKEIMKYANSYESKDGVFVGADLERYPCFDSEDYAYENRFFWNIVFDTNWASLKRKKDMLQSRKWSSNYCKLDETTTDKLLPMIYFGGDKYDPMVIGVCEDIVF